MTRRQQPARLPILATSALIATALCVLPASSAFAADAAAEAPVSSTGIAEAAAPLAADAAPASVDLAAATAALAATPWVTTEAIDQDGNPIALSDPRAANFVGNAYFKADGTFTMFALDDSPKMNGNWEMRVDDAGKLVRWIEALRPDGSVAFSRVVEIVELNENFFTYRVPGADGAYVDIVHEPTDHPEPGAGGSEGGTGSDGAGGSAGAGGGAGNADGGSGSSAGGQQPDGRQAGAGVERPNTAATSPGAKGAPQPATLATTGSGSHATAAAAGAGLLALLSGAALFAARTLRLHRS